MAAGLILGKAFGRDQTSFPSAAALHSPILDLHQQSGRHKHKPQRLGWWVWSSLHSHYPKMAVVWTQGLLVACDVHHPLQTRPATELFIYITGNNWKAPSKRDMIFQVAQKPLKLGMLTLLMWKTVPTLFFQKAGKQSFKHIHKSPPPPLSNGGNSVKHTHSVSVLNNRNPTLFADGQSFMQF